MVRTTLIFAGGRLLTRPGSLRRTLYIVRDIVTNLSPWQLTDGSLFNFGLDAPALLVSVVFIALLGVVDWWQQKTSVRVWIAQQGIVFRWLVYLGAVLAILVFGIYGPGYSASSFVYMAY